MATASEPLELETQRAGHPARGTSLVRFVRLGGATLAWLATAFAAALSWSGLGVQPSSCGGDCAALANSAGAALFGIPILALSFALHLTLWLTLSAALLTRGTRLGQALHTLAFALAALLLVGTAVYLTWGLVLGLACHLCLTLHTAALVAALGVFVAGLGEPLAARGTGIALLIAAPLALAIWGGATFLGQHHHHQRLAAAQQVEATLAAVCEADTCPAAATFPRAELPEDALVLTGDPRATASHPSTTMLLYIDFECAACRRELATMRELLRSLVTTGDAGLAILLRAEVSACDPSARGGDPARCEAPAALVCANRHGRGPSALAYLDWELAASPGYYTLEDRRTWLAQRVDPEARQCLDDELRLGRFGTVARHAEAARTLRDQARTHTGCGGPTPSSGDEAFWCFASTPSVALFTNRAPQPLTTARELALGRLTGSARARLLDTCLGGP